MSGYAFALLIVAVAVGVPVLVVAFAELLARVGLRAREAPSRRRRGFLIAAGIYALIAALSFVGESGESRWLLWSVLAVVMLVLAWYEGVRGDRSDDRG